MNRRFWQMRGWHLGRPTANNLQTRVIAGCPMGVIWSEYCYT